MTEQLERDLRLLFAGEAEQAPAAVGLAEGARRRVRQRRRSGLAWGAGVLVAASVAAVAGFGVGPRSGPPAWEPAVASSPDSRLTGALPVDGTASCAYEFSPRRLADRAFVFDGTVIAIGSSNTDRPRGVAHHAGVTFTVNEWFAGDSGPTITVDLPPPHTWSEDGLTSYDVGTRLLVSASHRWGGTTTADAAGGYCGFTRYYDESTADSWREATR